MTFKQLPDLKRRFAVSSITVLVVSSLLAFYTFLPVTIILVLCVAGLAGVGVWEYARLAAAKNFDPSVKAMIFISMAEVFAFFAAHKHVVIPEFPALVLVIGAIVFFLLHFKGTSDALANVAVEFFGVCYVSVPLSALLGILYPLSHEGLVQDGRWWLVYLIVVTKITDVGAYFVGKLWGKRKLAPILSPKKTVEGAIAGFICAVGMSMFISYLGKTIAPTAFNLPLLEAFFLGILIGVLAQVGDLAESLLKRDAVVKDSNTLPGLGGVLDMVDSLLLTAPIVYFYLKIV
ncbi:MAG: CDP-archaeol synthase [Chlamydiae bacterium]|nr:CDP-archaeol synthase [Chlamydiota bacterium]